MKYILVFFLLVANVIQAQERIDCPIEGARKKPQPPPICTKIAEYNPSKLMGNSYGVESGIWYDSTNSRCCTCFQNDINIISAKLENGQSNVIYLDFVGGVNSGNTWGTVSYAPAGLSESEINDVTNRVASHYWYWPNTTITTDSSTYLSTPTAYRQRIIFTTTCGWYTCNSGGTAIVNSFGTDVPAWVFTYPLNYNVHNIGESGAHEAGHTLGLLHQSKWQ